MQNTEYIKEINNPSIQFEMEGSNYLLCNQYLEYLEQVRTTFTEYLSACEESSILAYLSELESAKARIDKMGFADVEWREISALALGGLSNKAEVLSDYKTLFGGIRKSIEKTISFANTLLKGITVEKNSNDNPEAIDNKESHKESGTSQSDWLTLDEVCQRFNLSKNNIKSREWRIKHGFPVGNNEPYSKLVFSAKDVENWMRTGKC